MRPSLPAQSGVEYRVVASDEGDYTPDVYDQYAELEDALAAAARLNDTVDPAYDRIWVEQRQVGAWEPCDA